MKSNSLTAVLQGALAFSLLLSVIFFIQFYFKSHEIRTLQGQIILYQQNRARVNQLIAETIEYSKRNPEMAALLASAGIKPNSAPTKPAAK